MVIGGGVDDVMEMMTSLREGGDIGWFAFCDSLLSYFKWKREECGCGAHSYGMKSTAI